MKVLIISDIHGRLGPAKKAEMLIKDISPDRVFLLGDILYNGPRNGVPFDYDPMGVADILNRMAPKILAIRGNCDSRVDEQVLRFPLSDSRIVLVDGYKCDLIHGDLLTSELLSVDRGDILMFGHTHVPMLKKEDGVTYLNPGSISFPKKDNPPSYAIMEKGHLEIRNLDDHEIMMSLDL